MARLGQMELPPHAEMLDEGIAIWKNPHNKFLVIGVHYTADPDKRSLQWREEASAGVSSVNEWKQEFELDFSTWGGLPAFSEFNRNVHVAAHPLLFSPERYVYRAWDLGTHAVVWAQRYNHQLRLFGCRVMAGAFSKEIGDMYRQYEIRATGLGPFIAEVQQISEIMFEGEAEFKDIIDPSGSYHGMTRMTKAIDVFTDYGITPQDAESREPSVLLTGVNEWLGVMVRGEPALQIDPRDQLLIDVFGGGYALAEGSSSGKIKIAKGTGFDHVGDAVGYLCTLPEMRAPRRGAPLQFEEQIPTGDPARMPWGKETNQYTSEQVAGMVSMTGPTPSRQSTRYDHSFMRY